MLGNQKWKYFQDVAKPYALDILEELKKKPMRFSDLKKICLSQKTLTVRLHELEELNVIETIIQKPKNQKVIILYSLTNKGKQTLESANKFLEI